jgi:endoglucanase
MNRIILSTFAAAVIALAGCQTNKKDSCSTACAAKAEPVAVVTPVAATPAAPATASKVVRIKAGVSEPLTDGAGNVWLADQGFEGGDVIERPDLEIANTKTPEIYRSERYAMDSFSYQLPKGKYQVKLHFAETFEGITGPGERVFSFIVEGQEFKDFDVFKKAGGGQRAYVETVNVEIKDGKLDIKFTSNLENPEINGIEIIPQ